MSTPIQTTDNLGQGNGPGEQPGIRPGNGRRTLVLIFLVGFVPIVAAMLSYFSGIGIPSARNNHGELLLPVQTLAAGELIDILHDAPVSFGTDQPWRLVILPQDDCSAAACIDHLDLLRRLQVAMARDADRLSRCLLVNGLPATRQQQLMGAVAGMTAVREAGTTLGALAVADASGLPALIILDPLGNIVMRYTGSQNPHDVIDDLKRLLKVSRIG